MGMWLLTKNMLLLYKDFTFLLSRITNSLRPFLATVSSVTLAAILVANESSLTRACSVYCIKIKDFTQDN